jgi:MarR family transcriptional regulator, organic hydroperoxide resistance regulator
MEPLSLDLQLCFALYSAQRAMVQAYQSELEPLGLTYPQYLALLVLWEEDGITVTRLGERLHLDSGTLTPLTKRLEAQGLVARVRSSDDERRVEIHLTKKGAELKKRARTVPIAMFCKAKLPMPEFTQLRAALHRLTQTLTTEGAT